MNKTGIVRDMRYLDHVMGAYHPESPQRLKAIYEMLEAPDMKKDFQDIRARMAEREELLMIHSPDYIDILEASDGKSSTYLDPDTQTSPGSYKAALLAAVLPNPVRLRVDRPSAYLRGRQAWILAQMTRISRLPAR